MAIDRDTIRELTALLAETGLSEIEIEQDGQRIRVARTFSCRLRPRASYFVPLILLRRAGLYNHGQSKKQLNKKNDLLHFGSPSALN